MICLFIAVTIISVTSIQVPDPLHSTSTVFEGKITNESNSILSLKDVQKGKNISISVTPQNSLDILNVRILNPKGTLLLDVNSSQPMFTTITPTISGNYTAVLTNLRNEEIYTKSMFGSSVLFDSNRNPKIEIQVIFLGVIIFLIGIGICILWIILEFFERLRLRTRYKQAS
ncbi:MAG: hypothetical protein ACM31M_03100 [Nitrososphaerota archaeon]